MRKPLYAGALLAAMLCAGSAALAGPPVESTSMADAVRRSATVESIVSRFQGDQGWSSRYAQKLRGLNDARLDIATRAASLNELDMLFVEAPFTGGMRLGDVMNDRPGNVSFMGGSTPTAKSNPATNPTLYDDLVFTAVAPCRIYDSRFTTAPLDGTAGSAWPAGAVRTIDVGPVSDYSFQGGQATGCLGTLGGSGEVAAILGSVSTVNQSAAGYLVMFSAGGANPNPYGVVQYYQAGVILTSFLVMTTDLINPVFSQGVSEQASTHVIVDVVGYFARPKAAALDCTLTTAVPAAIAANTNQQAFASACAAGYTQMGIQCVSDSYLTWMATDNESNHCAYHNSDTVTHNISAQAKCCRTAGR